MGRGSDHALLGLGAVAVLMVLIPAALVLPVIANQWWRVLILAVAAALALVAIVVLMRRFERLRRKELEHSLRSTQSQLDFLWAVGHELRNPLTMMKASTSILRTEAPGKLTTEQRQFVEVIDQQTVQGIALCEDLLTQARLSTGTFRIVPRPTDLVRVIREIGTGMAPILEVRGQRIVYDVPRLMREVWVDRRAVSQILTNLLMNASRHSAEGAAIDILLLDNDTAIVLQVTDAGSGMTQAERAQAFEPFRSGAIGKDGTGLGLTITRNLVEAHGGRIYVDTRLATGTAFMVTLPKHNGQDSDR